MCSGDAQLHLDVQGRVDERHGFFWLDSLAPMDPQVPALPRTSQHLRGKRKRDFHSIKRYMNLTAWQMRRPLEVAQCRDLMSPEPPLDWKSTDSRAT